MFYNDLIMVAVFFVLSTLWALCANLLHNIVLGAKPSQSFFANILHHAFAPTENLLPHKVSAATVFLTAGFAISLLCGALLLKMLLGVSGLSDSISSLAIWVSLFVASGFLSTAHIATEEGSSELTRTRFLQIFAASAATFSLCASIPTAATFFAVHNVHFALIVFEAFAAIGILFSIALIANVFAIAQAERFVFFDSILFRLLASNVRLLVSAVTALFFVRLFEGIGAWAVTAAKFLIAFAIFEFLSRTVAVFSHKIKLELALGAFVAFSVAWSTIAMLFF